MKSLAALLLVAIYALPVTSAQGRPNIVLVLTDDHSQPYLGCYGHQNLKTPNLDRVAEEGMLFRRMFTSAPLCVPSRAALMTGRSPVAARMTRFSSPLPRDETTFPEILRREAGYFVGVCGRSYHLDGSPRAPAATEAVFEEKQMRTFAERFDFVDSSSQERVPEKIHAFFDQRPKDQPYFLWVNFNDPHHPWTSGENPPDPAQIEVPGFLPDLPGVRDDLSRHLAEIEHSDEDFQRVLDIVEARAGLENTIVIFLGDNGMAFPGGKGTLRDPGVNVPLLVWWRGVVKPRGDTLALISGEDIAPTALEAAGVAIPERMSGVSFLPLLKGEPFSAERDHVFTSRGSHAQTAYDLNTRASSLDYSRSVRTALHKLIYNVTPHQRYAPVDSASGPGWQAIVKANEDQTLPAVFVRLWFTNPRPVYELYDLEADPHELNNLYDSPGFESVTHQLKTIMQRKMILDFDYLPLPIGPDPRRPQEPAPKK